MQKTITKIPSTTPSKNQPAQANNHISYRNIDLQFNRIIIDEHSAEYSSARLLSANPKQIARVRPAVFAVISLRVQKYLRRGGPRSKEFTSGFRGRIREKSMERHVNIKVQRKHTGQCTRVATAHLARPLIKIRRWILLVQIFGKCHR